MLLELDSFFKTLRVKQKVTPEEAEKYFDEYPAFWMAIAFLN